jgi:hypothetical protein
MEIHRASTDPLKNEGINFVRHPNLADAILDRLVHNAYRIDLTGEGMRKQRSPKASETAQA